MSVDQPGFDRFGHLTELALDRLEADVASSDPSFFAEARAHLASCERCRARAAERDRARVVLAPAPRVVAAWAEAARPADTGARGRRLRTHLGGAGLVLAAAAVALVLVLPQVVDDGIRAKGGSLHFEVHVHDGGRERLVGHGDRVRPGERAAFGVRPDRAGHLLVFGWDDTGQPYTVWPLAAAPRDARALPIDRMEGTLPLPVAIRFDATPGAEHLMAILCPDPFALADVLPERGLRADRPRVPGACVQREVVLYKPP